MALLVLVLGLVVGNSGRAVRAPVNDALAAVDHVVVIPVHEDLAHGLGVLRGHGELLVVEVDRAAHALDLLDDDSAVLLFPLLASLEELLAADLAAVDALFLELLVDLGLGGDAGVIRADDPAGAVTAHAGVADVGVLDGVVERVLQDTMYTLPSEERDVTKVTITPECVTENAPAILEYGD